MCSFFAFKQGVPFSTHLGSIESTNKKEYNGFQVTVILLHEKADSGVKFMIAHLVFRRKPLNHFEWFINHHVQLILVRKYFQFCILAS